MEGACHGKCVCACVCCGRCCFSLVFVLFCFSFLFVNLVGLVMQNIKEEGALDRAPARGRVAKNVDDGTHIRFVVVVV
jgi:hypothetical protein